MSPAYKDTHTADPLCAEQRRIWSHVVDLLDRLRALEAHACTPDEHLEARLLIGQVRRLRRQSARISEVLRAEAWAREHGRASMEVGSGGSPDVPVGAEPSPGSVTKV